MKPIIKLLLSLLVLLAGCASDLHTKQLAQEKLKNKPSVSIIDGYLDLRYSENEGLSFSMFESLPPKLRKPLLGGVQLISAAALAIFLVISRKRPFFALLPLLLVLSGALGNVWDRLRYGYVIDFIYFHIDKAFSWPIFNIADILIAAGAAMMLLQLILQKEDSLFFSYKPTDSV
jgi:signal peptidase II